MVHFYDPKDESDQLKVEGVLRRGGVEYFLRRETEPGLGPLQILVAEEDLPEAERLVRELPAGR